jgi:hypothetical protein
LHHGKVAVNQIYMKNQEKIAELKRQIAELETQDDWRSKLKDPIDGCYIVMSNSFSAYKLDNSPRKPEHAFDTLERAELFAKKITLFKEMTNFAYVMNEGWVAKWGVKQVNWGVVMYDNRCRIADYSYMNNFIFGIAVKDKETAELMLQEFGERINEIYNLPC